MTDPVITDPNDPDYDPNNDPLFDRIGDTPPPPAGVEVAPVAPYGYYPSGTPRTEPEPLPEDAPKCPPVSASDYPFDTTTIYAGCNAPLTEEQAAYLNEKYAPEE